MHKLFKARVDESSEFRYQCMKNLFTSIYWTAPNLIYFQSFRNKTRKINEQCCKELRNLLVVSLTTNKNNQNLCKFYKSQFITIFF